MKRKGKIWFFVIAILIFALAYTTIMGVTTRYGDTVTPVVRSAQDIRFGVDIRGGVDVTFVPADGTQATEAQMDGAQQVIERRLIALGITDYEIYKDVGKSRIILRFPWQVGETEFNPETAIQELSATARLTFRNGTDADEEGNPTGEIILEGADITSAQASYGMTGSSATAENYVSLVLNESGTQKFGVATTQLAQTGGSISIWMDNEMVSAPTVNSAITTGTASISGNFTPESAKALADKINAGALPFALHAESFSTISPTLGSQSLRAMIIAGLIALALVSLFMLLSYRLVGFVAIISIIGQVAATLALISRYFVVFPSFTLTLPGIAGIILAIGMGVDANVITGERIREELRGGKKLDSAIKSGFQRGLAPIIDGNVTVMIVAAILMGAFGPSDSIFSKLFFFFGASTSGTIYSFGYTLMAGVVLNFVFGVFCERVMLTSISKMKIFRNPVLYGGLKKGQEAKAPKFINFNANRKKYFTISGVVLALILIFSFVFGVRLDVQFSGGAIVTYSYTGEIDAAALQTPVNEVLGAQASLQKGENPTAGSTLTITLPGNKTLDVQTLENLTAALDEKYPQAAFTQLEVNNVTATIGHEFLLKSIVSVILASLLILIYIAFRFRRIGGWRGGFTAVIALVHDLIIIYGVFVFLRIPLNSNFIAALLTILGYSINDTVVIYDRVRENRSLYGRKLSFADNVNLSINQSLRRSINTSAATMLSLGCVCVLSVIYGLDSIFTFVFPLMIGMVSGVYSTVCLAGPLWVMWEGKDAEKQKHGAIKGGAKAVSGKGTKPALPASAKAKTTGKSADKTNAAKESAPKEDSPFSRPKQLAKAEGKAPNADSKAEKKKVAEAKKELDSDAEKVEDRKPVAKKNVAAKPDEKKPLIEEASDAEEEILADNCFEGEDAIEVELVEKK